MASPLEEARKQAEEALAKWRGPFDDADAQEWNDLSSAVVDAVDGMRLALRALLAAVSDSPWTWERVARRVGEEFGSIVPEGYYSFDSAEWQYWMHSQIYEARLAATAPEEPPRPALTAGSDCGAEVVDANGRCTHVSITGDKCDICGCVIRFVECLAPYGIPEAGREALASFGRALLPLWWDGGNPGDIDGADAQDAAEEAGLWHQVERHADGVECEWCGNDGPCGELTEQGVRSLSAQVGEKAEVRCGDDGLGADAAPIETEPRDTAPAQAGAGEKGGGR